MKLEEVKAMGLTVEQYKQYFDEPIEDLVEETQPVAEEAIVEEAAEPEVETVAEEAVVEEAPVEETVEEVAEEPVEVASTIAAGASLEFENMRAAGKFLSETLSLKFTNTLDCLYKCLKAKNHKTHGYAVERLEDNRVFLTPISK